MSEDGRAAFGMSEPPMADRLGVAADSITTARLVEAAGWPATVADSACAGARIRAFDWRTVTPDAAALTGLPGDCGILCLATLETIDAIDALITNHTARVVFGDSPALIAIELSDLSGVLQSGVAFDSKRDERARLQALAAELARLAEQLGMISSGSDDAEGASGLAERSEGYSAEKASDGGPVVAPHPQQIRHLIAIRRMRDRFFSAGLFADPAWDILLDLAASRLEARPVSVSSLCIAAAVPPTTALRWIRMMTDQQLLVRRSDPADARRMFIALADPAFEQLCRWFMLVETRGGFGG